MNRSRLQGKCSRDKTETFRKKIIRNTETVSIFWRRQKTSILKISITDKKFLKIVW